MNPRARRRMPAVLVTIGVALAALVTTPGVPAAAADLSNFDPGFIISDAIFFDSTTMDAAQIQAFLNTKGASCVQGTDGAPCLKDYYEPTFARAATDRCPGAYAASSRDTAAQIIAKVAQACGVNPQVLIVTLQKEQSLVTTTDPSYARYLKAMGFRCPDSGTCDTLYSGFYKQVYNAASQFQRYRLNPTSYGHLAGRVNAIAYNPNAACGLGNVYIQNQATAGLYNYTPYQPNAAAMAAGYGTGDSCSAYGNRNFWNYFTDWFGPTTQRAPIAGWESVSSTYNSITVSGWALDPDTHDSIGVHVYLDGVGVLPGIADRARPDVDAVFHKGANHGYVLTVPATNGSHSVCLYAIDSAGGTNLAMGCNSVTVVNTAPIGRIDTLSADNDSISVSGWALDPDTTEPIALHFYVDGVGVASTTANGSRPDVGAAFGKGDNHGFSVDLPATPGTHQVCIYAIDSSGGPNPRFACSTATVTNHAPIGTIDTATSDGSTLTVTGWSLDPDTTNPIAVHVYVDGVGVAATTANTSRPDVGTAFGKGDNHGFSVQIPTTAGSHQVCIYAIDASGAGPNPRLACRTATAPTPPPVTNTGPIGRIDAATVLGSTVTVSGWALDPDTTNPIAVHVYVDGVGVAATTANTSRPDVGTAFGKGDNHGFSVQIPTTAGSHQVCAYAIDASGAGPNPRFSCATVTVRNTAPIGTIDSATTDGSTLTVTGWALDPDTVAPIAVHFYVDGVGALAATADVARPDLGVAFGKGDNHGFSVQIPTTFGTHRVCVYAIDSSGTGPNPNFDCRTV